jgi:hypothetical protein
MGSEVNTGTLSAEKAVSFFEKMDGAGTVVVSVSDKPGVVSTILHADGLGAKAFGSGFVWVSALIRM